MILINRRVYNSFDEINEDSVEDVSDDYKEEV